MTEHKRRRVNKASFFYERIGKTQFKKKQTREKSKFIVYRVKLMLTDEEVNSIFLFSALPRVFTFFLGFFSNLVFSVSLYLSFFIFLSAYICPSFASLHVYLSRVQTEMSRQLRKLVQQDEPNARP